ncbi:MAG: ABC transporter ATP-binding protein [Clostridiales Family XIII bacterium]|jgi:NitT/TauT family transport system ATP-binding protein|nr:ABC transporter ATP-binding protein [Clostridiales Family XIII bacterium]
MVDGSKILISTEDLGLVYKLGRGKGKSKNPKAATLTALRDVNIGIREGEFVSVVGPSGCGKSTLLYILAGLYRNTSGKAFIHGHEITGPSLDRGIIMQAYALFPWRTVEKNVEFGLEVKGLKKNERAEIAREFIELVGLSEFADRYPYELSGGMKQRIAIARALAYDPDVLLMDEPFAAVDEQTRTLLHDELLRIWDKTHKTIIFVTHSIDEAIFLSDRVLVMTSSPGTIRDEIEIELPRPRNNELKSSELFGTYRNKIWQHLQSSTDSTREVTTILGRHILDTVPQEAVI